ncbi:MAG: O-antigen ligase family protein [Caldilineales bacterium]|nr:O-antigen ligase family protein [Caldilineales bacterium]
MNTPSKSNPRFLSLTLAAVVATTGILAMGGYGWLLVFRPGDAEQLTALAVMGFTALAVMVNPLIGFLLWIFVVPFAQFLPFDIRMPAGVPDLGYARMIGGFLVILLLAQIARRSRRLAPITLVDVAIPLFGFALMVAAVRSSNGWLWGVQSAFDAYLIPMLVYFIARHLVQERRAFAAFAVVMLAIGAVIAGMAVTEQLFGYSPFRVESTSVDYADGVRKVAGLLSNPAYIAVTIAIILPLGVVKLTNSQNRQQQMTLLAILILFIAGIALTYNRSGWVAGLLALAIVAMLFPRLRKVLLPLLLIGGAAIVLLWGNLQDTAVGRRVSASSPIDYRLEALQTGLDISADEPLLGIGWGSFGREATQRGFRLGGNIHVLPTTHNTYLNLLVSGGYFLLGAFVLLILALCITLFQLSMRFRRMGRRVPLYLLAAWASLFAYFIPSAAFDNFFAIYTNIVFWGLMGAVIGTALAELNDPMPTERLADPA